MHYFGFRYIYLVVFLYRAQFRIIIIQECYGAQNIIWFFITIKHLHMKLPNTKQLLNRESRLKKVPISKIQIPIIKNIISAGNLYAVALHGRRNIIYEINKGISWLRTNHLHLVPLGLRSTMQHAITPPVLTTNHHMFGWA